MKIVLKRSRFEAGLTQAALARRAGVTQARIAQLESPDHGLKLETLERVAAALGLELEIAARRADAA
ncbi:MAG: helix-turn-helix domain-containing protein [Deltaproteobacteria bacterium]|nr:helix-turn-helix domain-containing protein [Deltaproteobacteria bacterium]